MAVAARVAAVAVGVVAAAAAARGVAEVVLVEAALAGAAVEVALVGAALVGVVTAGCRGFLDFLTCPSFLRIQTFRDFKAN